MIVLFMSTIILPFYPLQTLVHGDHESYLWQRGTNWKPELPSQEAGTFKIKNELCFALLC
jgi:hypothetical protein